MREGNTEAGASDTHSSDSGEHIGREISRRVEEQGQAKHGRFGWFLFNVLPPKVKGIYLSQVSIHSFSIFHENPLPVPLSSVSVHALFLHFMNEETETQGSSHRRSWSYRSPLGNNSSAFSANTLPPFDSIFASQPY